MSAPSYCSHQPANPLKIHPEPDISGLGVFIGFMSTSYILFFIIVVYYIFGYDPTANPFGTAENCTPTRSRPNPFDQLVLKAARRILCVDALQWQALYKNGRLAAAFDRCTINMADVQIVNGIAILIAGSVLLPQRLAALHWKMVVYLAWFSCTTNLSALTFLRTYLIHHPFEMVWRLVSTFILLVGLTVALVPTGHFFWRPNDLEYIEDASPSAYAICYFSANFKGPSFAGKNSMLLSILLLIFSYMVRVFKLCRGSGRHTLKSVSLSAFVVDKCLKSAAWCQHVIGTSSFAERAASNMIVGAHFVVCLWIDISTSMASDIFWLGVSISFGTVKMDELGKILNSAPGPQDDTTWSFGQILPVLLIAGPILILVRSGREAFVPSPHDIHRESAAGPDHHGSNLEEADITSEHDREPQPNVSITSTEIDVSRFNEGSANLVLDPARFTEYYEKSSWMCWAPVICLTYAITIAVVLISSRIDPILQMTNFMTWFILGQGALLQIHIVGFFYINMIWKHPTVHVAICSYLAAAIYISVALRSQIVLELSLGGEIFDSSYNSRWPVFSSHIKCVQLCTHNGLRIYHTYQLLRRA
ncbi:hypothetical protein F4819DRAFT_139444 [Hypoxylon fuscum]|nr:hypothetical protein F4819DRAFT_139444 [Hypoxylon fuscum]